MLTEIINNFLKTVYPNHCICCDKLITTKYFCKECDGLVAPIKIKTCKKCGHPVDLCSCKWNFYYFDRVIGCFENAEDNKTAFYRFKFGANFFAGGFFASHLVETIQQKYKDIEFDFIASVPADKSNKHNRRYNHVDVLAKKASRALKVKYKRLLFVSKQTPKQHESNSIDERYSNVKDKYSVLKGQKLKGKNILLIDDIKTTGATLSECARQLKLKGAENVFAAVSLLTYPASKNSKEQH